MKKVLVYGGTFNPIHKAHLNNIESALKKIAFDKVIIVPNMYGHFKNKDDLASIDDRIAMLELAIKHIKSNVKIEISRYEIEQNKKVYTYDLINHFAKENDDCKFYFLIGSDQVKLLDKWYKVDELHKTVTFIVSKRDINVINSDYLVINEDIDDISSTAIREFNASTKIAEVDLYIKNKGVYLASYIKNILSANRALHSCNVAHEARKLAKKYHIDQNKAYIAGILHDICKEIPLEKQYDLASKQKLTFEICNETVHAYAAATYVKEVLKIEDKEIIDAIKWHTTAYYKMSELAKLIYCCDMVSIEREYKEVYELRNILNNDLSEAFRQCFLTSYSFLLKKKKNVSQNLVDLKEKIERSEV